AIAIAKSFHLIRLPVPFWIGYPFVFPDAHLVSRVPVAEHVRGVVEDDIEDAVDTLLVRGVDEVAQVLACAEVRVDVEEVLNSVSVVCRFKRRLFENGADPDRSPPQPAQVSQLGLEAL